VELSQILLFAKTKTENINLRPALEETQKQSFLLAKANPEL